MGWKILVVDDEPDFELVVKQMFRKRIKEGELEFHFAIDGGEALSKFKLDGTIDLMLTDINMPKMDGLTLLEEIQKLNSHLVTVIISAYDDMDNIRSAMNRGAFDFLTKPIDSNDLERTLTKSIYQVKQQRENLRLQIEERRARSENKAKSEFLSNMSHEMRTPLSAIIGMTDLLLESELSIRQLEHVRILDSAGTVLLDLINNVLDLAKIEANSLELEMAEFTIPELIYQVTSILSVRCHAKDIELKTEISNDVPNNVVGDPIRLRQVLINLLGNAVKFTDHGAIELKVSQKTGNPGIIEFYVSDTGIGIAGDQLDHIFDRFSQGTIGGIQRVKGAGLGLSICAKLVEAMDGKMAVESILGEGSTFSFSVKLKIPDGRRAFKKTSRNLNQGTDTEKSFTGKSLKILIADDSEHNRKIFKEFLKETSHSISFAEDGVEAINAYINKRCFDLVFMDMQMPKMDGYQATREIRKFELEKGLEATPIIAITAAAFSEEIQNSLNAGCNETLLKPIRKRTLFSSLYKYSSMNQNVEFPLVSNEFSPIETEVRISKDFEKLAIDYLGDMELQLNDYLLALQNNRFGTIKLLSHRMKGTGSSFGFEALSLLGGKIEEAAGQKDGESIKVLLEELKKYYNCLNIIYV